MAKRKVTRSSSRQAIVRGYNQREWYDLPDWARTWLVDNAKWLALASTILLLPAAALGAVLSYAAFPLAGYLGVPQAATANDAGLAAAVLLLKFVLLSLSVRPLFKKRRRGWYFVIGAALVNFIHSIILGHAITSGLLLIVVIYSYRQVRDLIKA